MFSEALARITHLGIGAHQDDLEFMAFHGILACFRMRDDRWFGGVTCTNGAGSSRTGPTPPSPTST
jgi:LmbE family N-acetylglucosaminyl deacetylase